MIISENWLREWVPNDLDTATLCEQLTMAGLEVDSVQPVAAAFSGVVVAKIESASPHPNADRLQVCQVNIGTGESIQIVCGAPNACAGLYAPLAKIGAVLPEDFNIKAAELRGVASSGMLCSARELGISEEADGLLELPENLTLGMDLREALVLDDHMIDIDLTPNRADCLGIKGLAREVAAICSLDHESPFFDPVEAVTDITFPVHLDTPNDCPKYLGRVIEGIDATAETPFWMREKLRRCGLRSISPSVDVTNFVLLELGQPLHAFDLDKLSGEIRVRRSAVGEKLTLLTEAEVELEEGVLLIVDGSGPVAVAGIMGGLDTAVTSQTTNIFLECAWFEPSVIMGKARDMGLHTDASHRFERGVDPSVQRQAIERATALLLEVAGGIPGPVVETEAPGILKPPSTVNLRRARLNKIIGVEVETARVSSILQSLGMETAFDGETWAVQAPPARMDIAIEEDLIEEVARIYGYNNIPANDPGGRLSLVAKSEKVIDLRDIRQSLVERGYFEAINYSFLSSALLQGFGAGEGMICLANPLNEDMDAMRTLILPGLLGSALANLKRQHSRIRMFEMGVCFVKSSTGIEETRHLAGLIAGSVVPEQWGQKGENVDFYDIKGDVEALLRISGRDDDLSFLEQELPSWLHPGRSASIYRNGSRMGAVGCLHPSQMKQLGLKADFFVFELELDPLIQRKVPKAGEISRFPSIRRDLAFVVSETVSSYDLEQVIRASAGSLLEHLLVFDEYQGDNVEKGFKSLAIGLILQEKSRTLVDQEVENVIAIVVSDLKHKLGADLRG